MQPRRPPKFIVKKSKKQKEKPEESTAEQKETTDPNNQTITQNNDPITNTDGSVPVQGVVEGTDGTVMSDGSKQEVLKDSEGRIIRDPNILPQGLKVIKSGADLKDLKGREGVVTKDGTQETQDGEKGTSKDGSKK